MPNTHTRYPIPHTPYPTTTPYPGTHPPPCRARCTSWPSMRWCHGLAAVHQASFGLNTKGLTNNPVAIFESGSKSDIFRGALHLGFAEMAVFGHFLVKKRSKWRFLALFSPTSGKWVTGSGVWVYEIHGNDWKYGHFRVFGDKKTLVSHRAALYLSKTVFSCKKDSFTANGSLWPITKRSFFNIFKWVSILFSHNQAFAVFLDISVFLINLWQNGHFACHTSLKHGNDWPCWHVSVWPFLTAIKTGFGH